MVKLTSQGCNAVFSCQISDATFLNYFLDKFLTVMLEVIRPIEVRTLLGVGAKQIVLPPSRLTWEGS